MTRADQDSTLPNEHELLPEHKCTIEFDDAEICITLSGYAVIKASLRIIDGAYSGRSMFYYYNPAIQAVYDAAKYHGLPTTENDLPCIKGVKLPAYIRRRSFNGVIYNTVSPSGSPL